MKRFINRKHLILLISGIILSLCFSYILTSFQWLEIIKILKNAKLFWLLGAVPVSILIYWLLRTWRWLIILNNLNVHINFVELYLCNVCAMTLTIVTPLQSGEMLKVELLKSRGLIERFSGYSSFLVERVLDLFVVISLAALFTLTSFDFSVSDSTIIAAWLIFILILILSVYAVNKIKVKGKIGEFFANLRAYTSNIQSLWPVLLLTFCSWSVVAIGWQICLYSISIDLGFQKSMALMSILTIINILSIVPGAIGISEVSITEFLVHTNSGLASAQAGSLIIRFYGLLIIFLGLVHFLLFKLLKNKKNFV
ncbi:MAG: lysylphosphatidylglycerol synthase transmembrane domain-containing protein [Snowella sp.]|nr:lysylphosphatidylglycerol synthase transmembrane domain-containing protein [Snowella sp.]